MDSPEQQIADGLSTYSDEIRSFAQDLRGELTKETKPAFELAGYSAQSYNIGYGFTTTSWDCFCAIIVYRNHINISFPSGASLSDPEGLLHGKGSRVRHLKVRTLADIQTESARRLLADARTRSIVLLEDGKREQSEVTTVIKRGKPKG